ncbi:S24 family peptidase [Neptunomonas japonica]|uniref:S24 family peptidase n=1 Tax=Neptunomonas japonica TaxID=417574 RepID=UPI0003FD604F|nr:S24 family peptidase [Neptunomonas japonica]
MTMNSSLEKAAFGKRMSALLIENGFSKPGRGKNKGETMPDHNAFAVAYVKKANESLNYKSVEKWCKGESFCETKRFPVICELLDVNQEWLATGRGEARYSDDSEGGAHEDPQLYSPYSKFIKIPIIEASLAAGAGSYATEDVISEYMEIGRDRLEKYQINENTATIAPIRGESMEPTLISGDLLLVNTSVRKPISGKIFAFDFDGDLRIKRFNKRLDGSWLISSDNEDKNLYRDEVVSAHNINQLRIIGQAAFVVERSLL